MNSSRPNSKLSVSVLVATTCILFLSSHASIAASATWSANPSSSDWNSAANWTPMTVPNGPNDIATFQASSQTGLSLPFYIQVSAINFSAGANSFVIVGSGVLTISGTGITNDSGVPQHFYSGIAFSNSASAGLGALFYGGVQFHGTSTASSGTFNNAVSFYDSSTAGNGTFNGQACFHNQSTVGSAVFNGGACFADSTTADNATINGTTTFTDNSAAIGATLLGDVSFSGNSTGDLARLIGSLNVASHAAPGVAIGSIEGNGNVVLGLRSLTVGANNANTTFSGTINGFPLCSFTKTGTGTLVLTNSNTYTGGTIINSGAVQGLHDHALGNAPQNGGYVTVAPSAMLTLASGATNDYIADANSLQLMTGSLVNLNFSGAPDKVRSLIVDGVSQPPGIYGGPDSGAPNHLPEFTGTGQILANLRAVSRKVQGAAGTFDVDLPIVGSPGIECRSGGANSEYQMVVTFYSNVTFSSAIVLTGSGHVTSATGSGTNTITIDLTDVGNAQTINVVISDVNDGSGPTNLSIPMSVLVADVNGNGTVNASDVAQVKAQLGPVGSSNFRADVNANGAITASDVVLAKVQSGTHLP